MHYQRVMKHGDPEGGNRRYSSTGEALVNRVCKDGECLVWTGYTNPQGYGRMNVGNRKLQMVHRVAWELANGPIPDGMEIDHICFNRACVNVDHMRLVTRSGNTRHRRGAQPNSTSSVRNVHKHGDRWEVRLKVNGKHISYGIFDTIEEAAPVAANARAELWGE